MSTLVDANVLLDVLTDDPMGGEWSGAALAEAAGFGPLVINPLIYAEISVSFTRIEDLDATVASDEFHREQLPYAAGFLAGKAYLHYRKAGGTKTSPLPGFYIGAHAAISGHRLLSRDANRYRSYFPKVELISP